MDQLLKYAYRLHVLHERQGTKLSTHTQVINALLVGEKIPVFSTDNHTVVDIKHSRCCDVTELS